MSGHNGLIVPLRNAAELVPDTDGVRCFKFTCGHERIIAKSDYTRQRIGCVECERIFTPQMGKFQVSL